MRISTSMRWLVVVAGAARSRRGLRRRMRGTVVAETVEVPGEMRIKTVEVGRRFKQVMAGEPWW